MTDDEKRIDDLEKFMLRHAGAFGFDVYQSQLMFPHSYFPKYMVVGKGVVAFVETRLDYLYGQEEPKQAVMERLYARGFLTRAVYNAADVLHLFKDLAVDEANTHKPWVD